MRTLIAKTEYKNGSMTMIERTLDNKGKDIHIVTLKHDKAELENRFFNVNEAINYYQTNKLWLESEGCERE